MNLKDDGGSFDLLLRAAEKASNGDQDLKSDLPTARVIVNWQYQKAMEGVLSIVREEEEALQKQIYNNGSQFVHLCFKIPKKPRCNKRRYFTHPTKEEDDDDDYEKEEKKVRKPPPKKQRRTSKYDDQMGLSDVSLELKNKIERMKGSDVSMVMQKKLTATDMNRAENRLSVPRTKIRKEFLREAERKTLDSKEVEQG